MIKEMYRTCGNCPIQYEGLLGNNYYFYCRARYNHIEFYIATDKEQWEEKFFTPEKLPFYRVKNYPKKKYGEYYCGWMKASEVVEQIVKWVKIYLKQNKKVRRFD